MLTFCSGYLVSHNSGDLIEGFEDTQKDFCKNLLLILTKFFCVISMFWSTVEAILHIFLYDKSFLQHVLLL